MNVITWDAGVVYTRYLVHKSLPLIDPFRVHDEQQQVELHIIGADRSAVNETPIFAR